MAPRPDVRLGDYVRTVEHNTIRVKEYTAPPFQGTYLSTLFPGSTVGPVVGVFHQRLFTSVQVGDRWLNVWGAKDDPRLMAWELQGAAFAHVLQRRETRSTFRRPRSRSHRRGRP